MQAHADQIVADTELQVMAIASGASVDDAMGLNGLEQQQKVMIQAQADMVRQQAADTLWWKAFWSSLAAVFWQIASPITFIVNLLEVFVLSLFFYSQRSYKNYGLYLIYILYILLLNSFIYIDNSGKFRIKSENKYIFANIDVIIKN